MTSPAATDEALEPFDCPRCAHTVSERFWGPCTACRAELTALYGRAGGDGPGDGPAAAGTQSTRFEPAMHVVPNHVATKD